MRRAMSLSLAAGAVTGLGFASPALAGPEQPAGASADEVRAMVAEMLADAETRSSLLQAGGTAGHDGNFFLASPDGNFRLDISGQIQFRYNLNFRDDPADIDGDGMDEDLDDFEPGFQTRRTKLKFEGHVFDPDLFYSIQGAFNRARGGGNNGDFRLEDAYVGYRFGNGFEARWGQFKMPFLREELVSSKRQLAVDRSLVNEIFNQDRSQGIEVSWRNDMLRVFGAFHDGFNSDNTDLAADPADYALTGRVEYLAMGEWSQFRDFTSPRGSEPLALMVGGAVHWQDGPDGPGVTDTEIFSWTGDVSVEGNGWNAYGAYIGRARDADGGPNVGSATDHAFVAQGGIYVTEEIEPFVRWDVLIPDSGSAFNTLTFGGNYYIHGHAAKFTLDVQWFLDARADVGSDTLAAGNNTGIGFLDNFTEEDEFAVRAQFQLLF